MKLIKLTQKGFSHIVIPVLSVLAIAGVGSYVLATSHAGTCKTYVWRQGSRGQCVKDIQQIVNAAIPKQVYLTVDGQYGPNTTSGVRTFQSDTGISADGSVGPQTWNKLCTVYTPIDSSVPRRAAGC